MNTQAPNEGKYLDEFLKKNHPDIFNAIKKEKYNLDFLYFDTIEKIHFKEDVVGFIAFTQVPLCENQFEITESYIIPEFRGNNLLFNKLSQLVLLDNFEFYPKKPTRAFINVLLKNDYAFKLTPNFVVSYMKFMTGAEEIYKNPRIKRFYKNSDYPFPYKANLYDMELCSVMFRDPILEVIKYTDFFALTEPRKYDLKKYKLRKKLKRVSEKYIDDKYSVWENNAQKIESFVERKKDEFEESLLVENMLGSEDKLDENFIDALTMNNLTIEDGLKIRTHIIEKLNSCQLTKTSYWQRILYLLEHFEVIDKKIDDYDDEIEECPFCGNPIYDYLKSCMTCGLSIREIDFEEHAADELNNTMQNFFEGFMDLLESDSIFDDENIPIEENDEYYDLKVFYNKHMKEFDYDELLEFYKSNNQNLTIEEIYEKFLDDKLKKSIGTDDELYTYLTNLLNNFYYHNDTNKWDDAFVELAQMAILASNKSKDKNNMIESNPHWIDIIYAIECLENSNHSFKVLSTICQNFGNLKLCDFRGVDFLKLNLVFLSNPHLI